MSAYYKWFRSFFGSVEIKISGKTESFLNLLSQKKVYFWGTFVDENEALHLSGSVLSAEQIMKNAEIMELEAEVVERKGLPFLFDKYKKRYGIMVGVVIAWAILFLSSLVVWEVRVAERSGEDPEKIISLLEECGLEMGTFLPTLNVRAVENQFLLNNPEYSFLAVNIYGTVANIEIRRAFEKEGTEDKSRLCNVISAKDGTIVSVEAYGGVPVVKKGDRVSAGDVLISSCMEGSFGVVRYVHAYGRVMASVCYEYKTEIPLEYETAELTGREETKTEVKLLCFGASLFENEASPFEKCKAESSEEYVDIFGIKLPIRVEKVIYYEEEAVKRKQSESVAEFKAIKDFEMYMERELSGEIVSSSYECFYDFETNSVKLVGVVNVIEDIGEKAFLE